MLPAAPTSPTADSAAPRPFDWSAYAVPVNPATQLFIPNVVSVKRGTLNAMLDDSIAQSLSYAAVCPPSFLTSCLSQVQCAALGKHVSAMYIVFLAPEYAAESNELPDVTISESAEHGTVVHADWAGVLETDGIVHIFYK